MSFLTFSPRHQYPISIGAPPAWTLALLLTLVCKPSDVASQTNPFIEQNGLVVVQTENLQPGGEWVIESSDAGFTGSGYIRWNGADYFGTPGNGIIQIPFRVSVSGDYLVKFRSSHLGAPAGDQWNDAWFKMNDGGTWTKAGHPAANMNEGFTFDMFVEPAGGVFIEPRFYLEAGIHTLFISGRSYNYRIDRIHIYRDGTSNPEDLNHPQSARENGDGGGGGGGGGGGVYTLTINGGTGSGVYPPGTRVFITANSDQNGTPFDRWTGDTQYVDDIFAVQTSIMMPSTSITVAPSYKSNILRTPENPAGTQSQISYAYYEQTLDALPNFDTLTPKTIGTTSSISLDRREREDGFLFKFNGFVDIPTDGTYTFFTASDDGSQLFIGDRLIVDNDSIQSVQERSGEIGLKAGKHALTVTYFERTGDQDLIVSWMGPGINKQPIPASALYHGGTVSGILMGDVSQNGEISPLDASYILSHTIGQSTLDGSALQAADVSGNGSISAFDASIILQYVVGLLNCFPAEPGCSATASTAASHPVQNISVRR